MTQQTVITQAFLAFSSETAAVPSITLRGGNEIDDYKEPSKYDSLLDSISDEYLEMYPWGITYLDADSWRHYLPYLIEYAIRHIQDGDLVVDSLLSSLRPPDREPPRLGSLTSEQEAVIVEFLDFLAFGSQNPFQEFACQVLEEWWVSDALYKTSSHKTKN